MPVTLDCQNCHKSFSVQPKYKDRKFCSRTCMRENETQFGRPGAVRAQTFEFHCRECGNPFQMKQAYLTAYRKKFGKDPLYCSMPCSAIGRRKDADERHKTNCKNCGKEFYRTRRRGSGTIYNTQMLCSKQCKREWTSKVYREKNGAPTVTRRIKRRYVYLRFPAANGKPAYEVLEHRHVMEQHIGRPLLPQETVHHINGDRTINDLSNLELFSSQHGPGQRVIDKVQFAIDILRLYPEFARAAGVELREHVTAAPLP